MINRLLKSVLRNINKSWITLTFSGATGMCYGLNEVSNENTLLNLPPSGLFQNISIMSTIEVSFYAIIAMLIGYFGHLLLDKIFKGKK